MTALRQIAVGAAAGLITLAVSDQILMAQLLFLAFWLPLALAAGPVLAFAWTVTAATRLRWFGAAVTGVVVGAALATAFEMRTAP